MTFGTLFFTFDKGNGLGPLGFIEGFYQSVSIGYSVGVVSDA
jgi:hypothetical protein